jgi:putative aldouronate transport system substrate-binding protein
MKKVNYSLKYVCTLIMALLLLLSSCGTIENEQSPQNSSDYRQQLKDTGKGNIDISKRVNLTGYLIGSAPAGMPDVMAELNKKLIKDINATMEIYYISWTDLQSKYPLILATGEDVDWVFTAHWCSYSQEAAIGAFKEITVDALQDRKSVV